MDKITKYCFSLLFVSILFVKETSLFTSEFFIQETEEQANEMTTEQDNESKKEKSRSKSSCCNEESEETAFLFSPVISNNHSGKNILVSVGYKQNTWPDIPTPPPDSALFC